MHLPQAQRGQCAQGARFRELKHLTRKQCNEQQMQKRKRKFSCSLGMWE